MAHDASAIFQQNDKRKKKNEMNVKPAKLPKYYLSVRTKAKSKKKLTYLISEYHYVAAIAIKSATSSEFSQTVVADFCFGTNWTLARQCSAKMLSIVLCLNGEKINST